MLEIIIALPSEVTSYLADDALRVGPLLPVRMADRVYRAADLDAAFVSSPEQSQIGGSSLKLNKR